ncbi:UDP-glucose dehydrogenase family protein [Candidatus Paracaedibacter symbiosus]|uniref:UDP-glucose dehydrogenase family protein n=1 Tax=Candidatus Paracaedibacter symbiosus TaxID=244582 RepID=UPI0005098305|nr:UDP-glucose/GDP-mannose dehydrogenase family protein [Candidatus Paracaedibacter symbiosus]
MQITIIGAGYVGLVTGACFAEFGYKVTCVDKDHSKIDLLHRGISPIYEPGLDSLLQQGSKSGQLTFTTKLVESVATADVIFLAVGTPTCEKTGKADLSYVFTAAEEVGKALKRYAVIVTKSTVPVGTARQVETIIRDANPTAHFEMASNPEFLREGAAISDFMRPDRIVIGTDGPNRAQEVLQRLYRPLYLIETPMIFTGIETAELTKYASNAFLATKIAFINEMADICEKTKADVQDVAKAMGLDHRIGRHFLNAGPGYGGSCFPKDTLALAITAHELETPTSIVESVAKSNESRKLNMAQKIITAMGGSVKNKKIALLGLTFKPNTDDMRDAPSLVIIPELIKAGATVAAYDPIGQSIANRLLPDITYGKNANEVAIEADALVIVTEWNEFRALDLDKLKQSMKHPLIIDLRNIYKPNEMIEAGFDYISIGRPAALGSVTKI